MDAYLGNLARMTRGIYIADVLAVWDDMADTWVPGSPLILRLETRDLLFSFEDHERLSLHAGCFDTDKPYSAHDRTRWMSVSAFSGAIGTQVAQASAHVDTKERLIAVTFWLSSEEALRIDASGAHLGQQRLSA